VSELHQVLPQEDHPGGEPAPEQKGRGWVRSLWFGWWVAICLGVLAYHTNAQLEAQRRILAASQVLEARVADAAAVSAATYHQLGKVAELDAATSALAGTLQRLSQTNADIKGELAAMEGTVDGLVRSVERLDGQAVASHETLLAVARESEALLAALRRSQATGATVTARLERMVNLQTSINADLDEMNRNTRDLDRFLGR
jgi:chromosome segregation ATPase